jgi:hypothetical protein
VNGFHRRSEHDQLADRAEIAIVIGTPPPVIPAIGDFTGAWRPCLCRAGEHPRRWSPSDLFWRFSRYFDTQRPRGIERLSVASDQASVDRSRIHALEHGNAREMARNGRVATISTQSADPRAPSVTFCLPMFSG